MNKRYEAVVIFDSNLSDAEVGQQVEKIEAIVKSHNGVVERRDSWGRRELSYKIKKKSYGIYELFVISGDNELVSDLRRQLKINDAVLRVLIVDKDKYAPDMTRPLHAEPSPAAFRNEPRIDEIEPDAEEASV